MVVAAVVTTTGQLLQDCGHKSLTRVLLIISEELHASKPDNETSI